MICVCYVILHTSYRLGGVLGEDEFYEARGDTMEFITGVVDVQCASAVASGMSI